MMSMNILLACVHRSIGCDVSQQVQLQETIRDVKTLHNENLVAVAQKKYVYIYDNQGAEVTAPICLIYMRRSATWWSART